MNSYNENLQTAVITSLQTLELDVKKISSGLDASIITLYYAEGARITAAENLKLTKIKQAYQEQVKVQAVNNSNIAINLLKSASQQKAVTVQCVTTTAVGASNMQIASNAIVRLAANLGSVHAILSAADNESEIYKQSEQIRDYISKTAYAAKRASLSAMDSSNLIAEVSSSAIVDAAKVTNDSVTGLLKIISDDFDAIG